MMKPMMGRQNSGGGGAGGDGAADFLRRLSVADAKVLLERTKKEKANKTEEMQKMIGVRYRDLIESADKIVTMHSAAMRLESTLREMPAKWQTIDAALQATLTRASTATTTHKAIDDGHVDAPAPRADPPVGGLSERVLFLVDAHELLWRWLDAGETYAALRHYRRAMDVWESPEIRAAVSSYPFLSSLGASLMAFEQRIASTAKMCLRARGQDHQLYSDSLATLTELDPDLTLDDVVEEFLQLRAKWFELELVNHDDEADSSDLSASAVKQLRVNLRSMLFSIQHADSLFLADSLTPDADESRLSKLRSNDSADHSTAVADKVISWMNKQISLVSTHAESVIRSIDTIANIASIQSKLALIHDRAKSYQGTSLWSKIESGRPHASSLFELLFGAAFRRRTRDLIQNSFEVALEAVKTEIRSSFDMTNEPASNTHQLKAFRFFDFFEIIHRRVEGLKSSELQRVLREEYLRTLFAFVRFLEHEHPFDDHTGTHRHHDRDPRVLLGLANILISIVNDFPVKLASVFEVLPVENSIPLSDINLVENLASSHSLSVSQLRKLIKESGSPSSQGTTFIDEEMRETDILGLISFQLVLQVKKGAPSSQVFTGVLEALAGKYCECWAKELLAKNIVPLRDVLHLEQYNLTNEEWIERHQGWSEHLILDDDLEDDNVGAGVEGEKVYLPWCETPTVSSFLFSCCYALDEAYRLVKSSTTTGTKHRSQMHALIRAVLIEQLTIMSVDVYDEAVELVIKAKNHQNHNALNFGECCMQQFLFDMYFVRATLGFSDFVRFGWGDDIDPTVCSKSLVRLKDLFARMQDFIDPVDWEIYGPQLIENVVVQFRKSRLLFSSLSESSDIIEINGKQVAVTAQDTRPIVKLLEPVSRFSLLPVPASRRRAPASRDSDSRSSTPRSSQQPPTRAGSLFQEADSSGSAAAPGSLPSLKLQSLLNSTAGSNILSAAASGSNLLSAATSGSNLLSSAAKGMSFLSSATSSYLQNNAPTDSRSKYF